MPLRGAAEQPLPRRFITRPVHPLMAIDRAEVAPLRREIRVIQDSRFDPLRADIVPRAAAVAIERPVGPDVPALRAQRKDAGVRSEERRVGKGWCSTGRCGCDPYHTK